MAGRKPWSPTAKDRKEISDMIGYGLTAEQVAAVKGVSKETLYKYCKPEIDAGRPLAISKVVQTAFKMATSGKNTAMTIFWLKTQAKWKEPDNSEGQSNNGTIDALMKVLKGDK